VIVLIYDGHGSHVTLEMIDAAITNNILLFCLPPHTTHRLQPCDVGVFSVLKNAWNDCCDAVFERTGEPLKAKDVVHEYMLARRESFKEETIRQAWAKSGIGTDEGGMKPKCNAARFSALDFAPSVSTSTQLDLPDDYPHDRTEPEDLSSDDGTDDKGSDAENGDYIADQVAENQGLGDVRFDPCIVQ
jgi:hypothetical protein